MRRRDNLLLQLLARPAQGVILSPRRVAATHRLVCFALFALLVIRAPEIFYSRFATM